jgi:putative Holliday junction resolvase
MPESGAAQMVPDRAVGPHHPALPSQPSPGGIVLAFDFGLKRIGVAVGETIVGTAGPLTAIDARDNTTRFAALASVIAQWQPALLIVGLPLSLDGQTTNMTARCRRFANQLRGRFCLPVTLVDERLTSAEAETALRRSGQGWRQRKQLLDAAAAQIILQSYFDAAA